MTLGACQVHSAVNERAKASLEDNLQLKVTKLHTAVAISDRQENCIAPHRFMPLLPLIYHCDSRTPLDCIRYR